MSNDLGDKQKWLLALVYSYEERHDGESTPITKLTEAFFDDDRYINSFASWAEAEYAKSVLFQTRRAIRALIRRGLMEEDGTTVSHTGGDTQISSGSYCPKGYTVCKTYRLTDAGRVIGKAEDDAVKARVREIEEANPNVKETAERIQAILAKIQQ